MQPNTVSRLNNFRIIRHIAASAVIFSHAFVLTGGWNALEREPVVALTGISVATLAVNVFFLTSGYLVTQSLQLRKTLISFAISRALRIYPALIAVVLFSAFALGPVYSTLPAQQYLYDKSVYGYVGWNSILLFPLKMRFELPGVFNANPYPSVVNGSLWTLPWEIWMYIGLALMGAASLLRKTTALAMWLVFLVVHTLYNLEFLALGVYWQIVIRFATYFGAGVIFFFYRNYIPISFRVLGPLAIGYAITAFALSTELLLPIMLGYSTFFLAFWQPIVVARLSDGPDFSYGIYLYAYPMQQMLVQSSFPSDPYLNFVATLALTLPFAAVSWFLVEKPALRLKPRLHGLFDEGRLRQA